MSGNFRSYDRDTLMLMPASLQDWLPETHLARFVESVIERLDVGLLRGAYAGRGKAAYAPEMLLALLFYGYSTGVMSSRRIEQACYDSVPFRYLSGNTSPDHVTISEFRRRFLPEMKKYFVQILLIAGQAGMLKLGTVSLDGTKIHANASKHQATSLKRARAERKRLEGEVQRLLARAELADVEPVPEDGMNVPDRRARARTDRLRRGGSRKRVTPTQRWRPDDSPERSGQLHRADVRATVDWLNDQPFVRVGRIATLGFGLEVGVAAATVAGISAAAVFDGGSSAPDDHGMRLASDVAHVHEPVLLVYAADSEASKPPGAARFAEAMREAAKPLAVQRYPKPDESHAFGLAAFPAGTIADAWDLVEAFFTRTLR